MGTYAEKMIKDEFSLNFVDYADNDKSVITYFRVSKDKNGVIMFYLRLRDKQVFLNVQPQITLMKEIDENTYKNYLLCFAENCDDEQLAAFEIQIPYAVYHGYIGFDNFHYSKNKDEYYMILYPNEFDYDSSEELYSQELGE